MRAVVTRVKRAHVLCGGATTGRIGSGLLALIGIRNDDGPNDIDYIANKISGLRIFDDENGVMNCSLTDNGGSILLVSQFTLYGDTRKGRRPSYNDAANSSVAEPLFESLTAAIAERGHHVETGTFGGSMQVESVNDGPVTILLSSRRDF